MLPALEFSIITWPDPLLSVLVSMRVDGLAKVGVILGAGLRKVWHLCLTLEASSCSHTSTVHPTIAGTPSTLVGTSTGTHGRKGTAVHVVHVVHAIHAIDTVGAAVGA